MTHTIITPISLPISINTQIVDKNISGNKQHFSSGWQPRNMTLAELAEAIDAGFAFAPQFKDGQRLGINFETAGFIAIDSDGTLTLEQALSDPFIQQYAALWYKTASHGEDGIDHFRIVFVTENPILKSEQYRAALLGLAIRFGTDDKIADGARCFYGSRGSHPTILGNILLDCEVKALIAQGRAADEARRSQKVATEVTLPDERGIDGGARANRTIPDDLEIHLAHGGTGTIRAIPPRAAVHCPFHDDVNPSAFTLRSKKGHPGLHCMACKNTWWAEDLEPPTYDFYLYDKAVQSLAAKLPQWNAQRLERGESPSNKEAVVLNTKYLPDLQLQDGVTLVKSPKGTGKTTALKKLVAQAKARGKSVLLIGHRVVLLRELATKLELDCYLDDGDLGGEFGYKRPDHYAVSIDSLPRRLFQPRPYDIIIIDECEQVFRHVIAKTVKNPNAVMTRLLSYIGDSPSLYLLDADLNQVTMHFVFAERAEDPIRMIHNTYVAENRPCDLYDKPEDLIVDMIKAVRAGKRLFVACNSKRRAKLLSRVIAKELGDKGEKVLLITAEEKVSQEVQDFLADIPTKYLQYRALIASPAIGTGIDITFPGHARQVDAVYGFFNSGINSHYDVDQQLGRVRDPGEVKVWICDRTNFYETELDAVKLDLVQTGDAHPAVKGWNRGVPIIDMDHPLLTLQATAYSAERASHNKMKHYFLRHKELTGWPINRIAPSDSDAAFKLQQRLKRLQKEIEEEFVGGVMNAAQITEEQWKAYYDRRSAGETMAQSAIHEMTRFELRHFYNDYVTPEMIERDDHGRFREAVNRFEALHIHTPDYLNLLNSKWAIFTSKERDLVETLGTRPLRSMEGILLASGLLDESGLRGDKIITKDDLGGFLLFCNERRVTVERDLGVNLRKDRQRDPVKTLNLCLEQIGLRVACLGKTRSNDQSLYRYQLDADCLNIMRQITGRRKDKNRSTLPEVLQPPRAPSRMKPANDNGEAAQEFPTWMNFGDRAA